MLAAGEKARRADGLDESMDDENGDGPCFAVQPHGMEIRPVAGRQAGWHS